MTTLFLTLNASSVQTQLDIVKVGLTAGVAAGVLVTLLLAVRRQLRADESVDAARRDSNERLIINLYTKGVEQFGADKPEVRIGGLYALERLAEGSPDLREQVVDIVCAALKGNPTGNRLKPQSVAAGRSAEGVCGQLWIAGGHAAQGRLGRGRAPLRRVR
jgi:hypothetical protein